MLVNFTSMVLDFQGMPIQPEGRNPTLYKDVAIQALTTGFQEEVAIYESKYMRLELADRIRLAKAEIEISFIEAMLITELVSRIAVAPLMTWRFAVMFETALNASKPSVEQDSPQSQTPASPQAIST